MPNIYLKPVIAVPSTLEISAITNSSPMVITADPNSDQANVYIVGMFVRLNIPTQYGMQQAAGKTVGIISVNDNLFIMGIDSSNFDPFVIPDPDSLPTPIQPASFSPAGSRNLEYNNQTNNVPFKSLNNQGN